VLGLGLGVSFCGLDGAFGGSCFVDTRKHDTIILSKIVIPETPVSSAHKDKSLLVDTICTINSIKSLNS